MEDHHVFKHKSVKGGLGVTALVAIAIPPGAWSVPASASTVGSNGGACPGRVFINNVQNLADDGTVVGCNGTA
jgi:hypothetical protein